MCDISISLRFLGLVSWINHLPTPTPALPVLDLISWCCLCHEPILAKPHAHTMWPRCVMGYTSVFKLFSLKSPFDGENCTPALGYSGK